MEATKMKQETSMIDWVYKNSATVIVANQFRINVFPQNSRSENISF